MLDKFGDYMYYLLSTPLKTGNKALNQFFIFFKIIGKLFDDTKNDIFKVRDEAMIISASPVMLPIHGQERDMKRLVGEDIEAFRTRLSMKALISEKAGSKEGILMTLAALGYEQSFIEPMWKQDVELWSEYIIFLRGKNLSGVNNLNIIDSEVMKVKQASGLPHYGTGSGNSIKISSLYSYDMSQYPLCNTIVCGIYPYKPSSEILRSNIGVTDKQGYNENTYKVCSEKTFMKGEKL